MAVTVTQFRTRFPEFVSGTYTDAQVTNALEEATLIHSVRELATMYLAAHLLVTAPTIANAMTSSGELMAEGAGPLRANYKTQADSGAEVPYTASSYGRRFLMLEKRTPRFAISAMAAGKARRGF